MLTTEPAISQRPDQPYVAIRTQLTMQEMGSGIIPQLHDELLDWLAPQGKAPAGPPFMRFYVINMPGRLDVELGWIVADRMVGTERINTGVLPAGRYASLVYTGVANGIAGNAALLDWTRQQGLVLDQWTTDQGDAFAARIEFYLTDPADEPDMAKWETEVAIKLADDPAPSA